MATTTLDITHWIGGGPWGEPQVERWGEVFDPSTGERQARVAFATRRAVDAAVAAAVEAQPTWGETPVSGRVAILRALGGLLRERADEVAELVTAEHGKTLLDAAGEVTRGLEAIDAACAAPRLLRGEFRDQVTDGVDRWALRRPLGVCVGVTPSNLPVMLPLALLAPALAAGNAFVLKPSEDDPSPAMLIAELLHEAGLPDGVLNVVHGDRLTLDALLDHPAVGAVSFVGSTAVAKYVHERAAAGGKRCRALGAATSHLVVAPDADLEAAADALADAAYGSAGQRCASITTAIAVGAAGDPLVAAVTRRARALAVGPGAEASTQMGPLASARARDRVLDYVERAVLGGAELVLDGRGVAPRGHRGGYFVGPCLLDRVSPSAPLHQDELSGPVLLVIRADTLDDALAVVRDDPRSNASALFTRSAATARRFQREVSTRLVGINVGVPVSTTADDLAAWTDASLGALGSDLDPFAFYTRPVTVTARWGEDLPRSLPRGAAKTPLEGRQTGRRTPSRGVVL